MKWFLYDSDTCIGPFPSKRAALEGTDFRIAMWRKVRRDGPGSYTVKWRMFSDGDTISWWLETKENARRNGANVDNPDHVPGKNNDTH